MPELVNTSVLDLDASFAATEIDDREVMIDVDHVSMIFNMASENLTNLKEYVIKLVKGELYFEEFTALDDISFQVRKGDVYGIMGTNGSGKSTLLKIIAGVLEPTKGTCSIKGSIAPLIELGAGFDSELSARENIYLNGALLGYSHDFIDQHFDEIVKFAEIEKFLDMPLKNYSSGMVSRIAFAIATVIIPEILLVDEVLSVGDFMFQRKCERRITELIEKHGVTVLIVSHSNDQIARLCNKCIWIEKGHTRIMGEASTISSIYGALGGRVGSGESEQVVFNALKRQLGGGSGEGVALSVDEIGQQNQAQTCVSLAHRGWRENPRTVILASGHTHVSAELAAPLAKALGAPVLAWNFEEAPVETAFYLQGVRPERIITIDCRVPGTDTNVSADAFDWSPEVISFRGLMVYDLSMQILEYGATCGLWGDEVVLADFMDGGVPSYSIGIYAANRRAPIVGRSDDRPKDYGDVAKLLKTKGFAKATVAGSVLEDSVAEAFEVCGFETAFVARTRDCEAGLSAQVASLGDDVSAVREVVVSAAGDELWPRLFGVPGYVVNRGGLMLCEDTENLDSVAAALEFSKNLSPETTLLRLLGDNNLNDADITMLASQASANVEG